VSLARRAEELRCQRVWYGEHHAPTIEERVRSITLLAEAIPPAAP